MQDKILKIAESLGLDVSYDKYKLSSLVFYKDGVNQFNPYENDADAFKVLEDLIKAQKESEQDGFLAIHDLGGFFIELVGTMNNESFENKDLKHAICEAYLSLIQQEEGE